MTGADERDIVTTAMARLARDMAPVDVVRLARTLALPIDAVPVDLAVAQSREVEPGSSSIMASAALIVDSADPAFWLRELLCRGDLAPPVIAIAVAVCAQRFAQHPLASLPGGGTGIARSVYDLHFTGSGVGSLDLQVIAGGDRLVLLDGMDPLASWLAMEARRDEPETGAAGLPYTYQAGAGRFQSLWDQMSAGSTEVVYVGTAIAIVSPASSDRA